MNPTCTCGAQLYLDSLFCHKCGKPQRELAVVEPVVETPVVIASPAPSATPPVQPIGFSNRAAVRVALGMAALAFLLRTIPIPLFAFAVVLWLPAAGFLAVYFYQRKSAQPVAVSGGARLGWLTGLFYFLFELVMFVVFTIGASAEGGIGAVMKKQLAEQAKTPEMEQVIALLDTPAGLAFFLGACLAVMFFFFTGLPMLGGAMAAKVLEKE